MIQEILKELEEIAEKQIFTIDGKKGTLKNTYIYESLKSLFEESLKRVEEEAFKRGCEMGARSSFKIVEDLTT